MAPPVALSGNRRRDAPAGFDADAQAIIAAMTAPSSIYQTAINAFVVGCKADATWSTFGSLAMFAAGSETNALVDWKLEGNWVKGGTPTFTANQGYTGNGTDGQISSPTNNDSWAPYTQNSNATCYYVRTYSSGDYGSFGVVGFARHVNNVVRIQSDGSQYNPTANTSAGLKSYVRTGAAAVETFYDSTSGGASTETSGGLLSEPLIVLYDDPGAVWGTDQISFVSMGSQLTGTQCGLLSTRVANFLTAVA